MISKIPRPFLTVFIRVTGQFQILLAPRFIGYVNEAPEELRWALAQNAYYDVPITVEFAQKLAHQRFLVQRRSASNKFEAYEPQLLQELKNLFVQNFSGDGTPIEE